MDLLQVYAYAVLWQDAASPARTPRTRSGFTALRTSSDRFHLRLTSLMSTTLSGGFIITPYMPLYKYLNSFTSLNFGAFGDFWPFIAFFIKNGGAARCRPAAFGIYMYCAFTY